MENAKNGRLHYKVVILGGGTGGISLAARLIKHLRPGDVAVVEPSQAHYYQPLWTLVGAGLVDLESTRRSESSVIPDGVEWIRDSVKIVRPAQNEVECKQSGVLSYETLIVATGLRLDFEKIEGAVQTLGQNGVGSIYSKEYVEATATMLRDFSGGHALFTMPPVPIKCAGAPQKIMYLADDIFRQNGVRARSKISFATAGKVIFGIPAFAQPLMDVARRKEIDLLFSHKLVKVEAEKKQAMFEVTVDQADADGQVRTETQLSTVPYDLLHIVPPMSAHDYVRESGLAFADGPQAGWLKVDPYTLQHMDFPNIFGVGDVTGVPNSKTGAAVRKMAPVVEKNVLAFIAKAPLKARYDGYSSCPLITGFGKVILAEFGYDGKLMPSFPFDQTKERRSMWHLKKDVLPQIYWHGMLKGRL